MLTHLQPEHEDFIYRFLKDSHSAWLEQHHLLWRYEFAASATVHSLITQVANDMRNSPSAYQFASVPSRNISIVAHEALPLQLYGLVARGVPRPRDQLVRIVCMPTDPYFTLEMVAADRRRYAAPVCIEGDRFAIHLGVTLPRTSALINHRRHKCLGLRLHSYLPTDSHKDDGSDDGIVTSGGETDGYDTDEFESEPAPISNSSVHGLSVNPPARTTRNTTSSALGEGQNSQSFVMPWSFLPPKIWDSHSWTPPPSQNLYSIDRLATQVFQTATSGISVPRFVVEGNDVAGLCQHLDAFLTQAIKENDFTTILSPNRTFQINDHNGDMTSLGIGIEREVIHTLFSSFIDKSWLTPHADNHATLAVIYPESSWALIPEQRLVGCAKLGALTALMLIQGHCPSPLDPLILQYFVHDKNFHSLTPTFVGKWHPNLRTAIFDWVEAGHSGNISHFHSHFASYLDLEVCSIGPRTEASHGAFIPQILYQTVFGPHPPFHPEWKAFYKGFKLSCRNGFSFLSVPKSFNGGSETFFSLLWTSQVKSYECIRACIPNIATSQAIQTALYNADEDRLSFADCIVRFLKGTGLPCPDRFQDIKGRFGNRFDFSQVDSPAFRPRMFLWAATGAPFIDPNDGEIEIAVVEANHPMYAENAVQGQLMASQGRISFQTCSKSVRFPACRILGLAGENNHTPFHDRFDYWILTEILEAIGGHSIL
ncbi:uncharacterized protein LACBIDRAFT_299099 [Laccaria bicolor S238N-H82]|uniref:Predicted protein n=1 Tax=Laccaria bicolor (strain S238N-H82 / ATCC MYA-4686) TaxID=486041 RepID=B0DE14_LACBS|nr:uncharacterized protein LACBIDRAFT_299099 [Laccaria bicolor S238N-H82]EDR07311.1 predicted protein [Laccaria bicolor S238N-H82]|eukprot:XP_001882242.1 predicted protein [Laccaria bicolor S238N-H82]